MYTGEPMADGRQRGSPFPPPRARIFLGKEGRPTISVALLAETAEVLAAHFVPRATAVAERRGGKPQGSIRRPCQTRCGAGEELQGVLRTRAEQE